MDYFIYQCNTVFLVVPLQRVTAMIKHRDGITEVLLRHPRTHIKIGKVMNQKLQILRRYK